MKSKKILIVGNWKNTTNPDIFRGIMCNSKYDKIVKSQKENPIIEIVVAVPTLLLHDAGRMIQFDLASQDISAFENTVTGETNVKSIRDDVKYAIIGHSERRIYLKESNEIIRKKVDLAIKNFIKPIVCIGESLQERQNGNYLHFLKEQLQNSLPSALLQGLLNQINRDIDSNHFYNDDSANEVSSDQEKYEIFNKILHNHISEKYTRSLPLHVDIDIAYEPVWAIGTEPAKIEQIEEVANKIASWMKEWNIRGRILYGGSVSYKNTIEILNIENIQGLLIGGASKDFRFLKIIKLARDLVLKKNK